MPTIPPPDEDARWVYSSGQPLGLGLATPPQGSTPPSPLRKTLSRLSLGSSRPPSAEVEVSAFVAATPSRDRRKAGEDSDKDAGKDARKEAGGSAPKDRLGRLLPETLRLRRTSDKNAPFRSCGESRSESTDITRQRDSRAGTEARSHCLRPGPGLRKSEAGSG